MRNMRSERMLFEFSDSGLFEEEETSTDIPKVDVDPVQAAKLYLFGNKRHDRYIMLANSNLTRFKMIHALRCAQKALNISMFKFGGQHLQVGNDLELLGKIVYLRGDHSTAESIMARSRHIKQQYMG